MTSPPSFPTSFPPPALYPSPSASTRGSHGCPLTCIRSQQAFDYAEEPADAGRSCDSLLDWRDEEDARADADALIHGAARDTALPMAVRSSSAAAPASPSAHPSASASALPSPPSSVPSTAAAAWNVRWVEAGGSTGGLPAALRRAAGLVRGRSGR